MKRLALLIAALSLAGTAWAQQAGSTPTSAQVMITPDEWQELRTARSAALQSNPDLVAENKKLLERMKALDEKLNAAMVKADPTIAPVLAKLDAARRPPGMPAGSSSAPPPAEK